MSFARQTESEAADRDPLGEQGEATLVWPHGRNDQEKGETSAGPARHGGDAARRLWVLTKGSEPEAAGDPDEADPNEPFPGEGSDPLAAFVSEAELTEDAARAKRRRWATDRWLAVAFAAIAVGEAVVLLGGTRFIAGWRSPQGTLRVVTESPGAEVTVDGVRRGASPVALTLAAGAHRVEVRQGDGLRAFDAEVRTGAESAHYVDLSAGVRPDAAAPMPATASIEIASDPPGGRVSIDGKAHGAAPVNVADLTPGPHEIRVTDGNGTVTRQVRLIAGVNASLMVAMPRPSTASSGWVRIRVPITAQIYQGSALIGTTDVDRLMLPAGRHTLRLVNRELSFSFEQAVTVSAGQTSVINVTLPNGLLNVNALPWAQVWIDGQMKGETPIGRLAVPIGVHEVVFRHPELGEQRRSVTVTQGGVARVGVDLRQ